MGRPACLLRRFSAILALCLASATLAWAEAKVIYVDHAAAGANNGTSWANAFTDLSAALDAAASGDQIWVAQGRYKPSESPGGRSSTFQLKEGVALYGGFASGDAFADRNWKTHATGLNGDIGTQNYDADNCYHVVTGAQGAVLDGFFVQSGKADGEGYNGCGAGMLNIAVTVTVSNCFFAECSAYGSGAGSGYNGMGGGLFAEACTLTVNDTEFNGCGANSGGALAAVNACSATLRRCDIVGGHTSDSDGAGVLVESSSATIVNCLFRHCEAASISLGSASGGAIANWRGITTVTNCTIADCRAHVTSGICNKGGSLSVKNSILWANLSMLERPYPIEDFEGGTSTITYSCTQYPMSGVGNLTADPQFSDLATFSDFHLRSAYGRWSSAGGGGWVYTDGVTSPCVDGGDPADPVGEEQFFNGNRINMGAYGGTAEASKSRPDIPPVANDDVARVPHNTTGNVIDVVANDTDADGDALWPVSVTSPAHGTASLFGDRVKYTPEPNFPATGEAEDSFQYTVSDGYGGTAVATVRVTVSADNFPPVLGDDLITVDCLSTDNPIYVLENDSDPDGETVTLKSLTQPEHGTATIVGNYITYAPEPGFIGKYSFQYTATDGQSDSTATVNVLVWDSRFMTQVFCAWGRNDFGQLGDGTTTDQWSPIQVINKVNIKAIACGATHTLVLHNDGTVWGWGQNIEGQLGDGTIIDRPTEVQVSGLKGIKAIAAKGWQSYALGADGTMYAWGGNSSGNIGDGTWGGYRTKPVKILTGVKAITNGPMALSNDGTVWVWGILVATGQSGLDSRSPTKFPGISNVVAIAPGHFVLADGTVRVQYRKAAGLASIPVPGLLRIKAAAAGAANLFLDERGRVWAYGQNLWGELGIGTSGERTKPELIRDLAGVRAIAVGGSHSMALLDDGTVWACGQNNAGAVGDGTNTNRWGFVKVVGITNAEAIAAGDGCSFALQYPDGTHPRAVPDEFFVSSDEGAAPLPVLANDEGTPLAKAYLAGLHNMLKGAGIRAKSGPTPLIAKVTKPKKGATAVLGDCVVYTPPAGYSGTETFQYTIADGRGGLDAAAVKVNVIKPVIVDKGKVTGRIWLKALGGGCYGKDYLTKAKGTGAGKVEWQAKLARGGRWEVFAWWPAAGDRGSNCPFTVYYLNGSATVPADQRANGGKWNSLGVYRFPLGTARVALSDAADGAVNADAIKFVFVEP